MIGIISRYGLGFFIIFAIVTLINILLGTLTLRSALIDLLIALVISIGGTLLLHVIRDRQSRS
ncbi:hypothetical protein [Kallotenue papyrolyticum]|uniref:hypothetical protein n=1 Tax=Kallotenue papyrolyticum TaxID=1325125 RepID=UPI000492A4D3|nr:hypothetical protein [Kallotenue papyrolyticum]